MTCPYLTNDRRCRAQPRRGLGPFPPCPNDDPDCQWTADLQDEIERLRAALQQIHEATKMGGPSMWPLAAVIRAHDLADAALTPKVEAKL